MNGFISKTSNKCLEFNFKNISVPSAPLNVSTHSITNTSVTVTWEEPSLPNGVIEGYRFEWLYKRNIELIKVFLKALLHAQQFHRC